MDETHLKNIVAFCLLMENGKGIMDKSPNYIIEKFTRYCLSDNDGYNWGLDVERKRLLEEWTKKWLDNK